MTRTHAIARILAHALVGLVIGLGGLALAGCEVASVFQLVFGQHLPDQA